MVGQRTQQASLLLQLLPQSLHLPDKGLLLTLPATGVGWICALHALAIAASALAGSLALCIAVGLLSLIINRIIPACDVARVALLQRRAAGFLQGTAWKHSQCGVELGTPRVMQHCQVYAHALLTAARPLPDGKNCGLHRSQARVWGMACFKLACSTSGSSRPMRDHRASCSTCRAVEGMVAPSALQHAARTATGAPLLLPSLRTARQACWSSLASHPPCPACRG